MNLNNTAHLKLKSLLFLAVFFFGVLIRFERIPLITLWSDEYATVRTIKLPILQIITGQYLWDLTPPFYFVLLKAFLKVFGQTESMMRLFSLVCAAAALVMFFLLARELLHGFWPALAALSVFTFHPLYIYYATEIRAYSLLILLSLTSMYGYLKYKNTPQHSIGWLGITAVCLAASLYTQQFGVLVFIAVGVLFAIDLFDHKGLDAYCRKALFVFVIPIAGYIPGLFLLKKSLDIYPNGLAATPLYYVFQVFSFSFHSPAYEIWVSSLGMVSAVLGLLVLILQKKHRASGLFLLLTLLVCTIFVLLLYFIKISFLFQRHLLGISFLTILATGGVFTLERRSWTKYVLQGVGIITILVYIVYGVDSFQHTQQENQLVTHKADYKQLSKVIAQVREDKDALVFTSWDETPVRYYLIPLGTVSDNFRNDWVAHRYPQYLLIISPNSVEIPEWQKGSVIYEEPVESLKLLRIIDPEYR